MAVTLLPSSRMAIVAAAVALFWQAHAAKPLVSRPTGDLAGVALAFTLPREYEGVNLDSGTAPAGRPVYVAPVVDLREKKSLVGSNVRKSPARVVTTTDTMAVWVRNTLKRTLGYRGVFVADSTDSSIVLSVSIRELRVSESRRYETSAALDIELRSPSGEKIFGKKLTTELSRWGRTYKVKNYLQCLSEVLFTLSDLLTKDSDFTRAVWNR